MDFSKPPLSDIVETLRTAGLQILIIVIVAFVVLRVARLSLHGILKALLDREATEGTAQELSAIEVTKRLDTLDRLGGTVIRFFVIVIAGLMILDDARDRHRAGGRRPRRRRDRGRLRRPEPRPRLPQRLPDPHREPVQPGRRGVGRRRHRHGRGLQPAADDAARPRRRRPHGPERRDQGRLEPDPDVGPDQPERRRRCSGPTSTRRSTS